MYIEGMGQSQNTAVHTSQHARKILYTQGILK